MNKSEKKLIRLYEELTPIERQMLISYAAFLVEHTTKNKTIEVPIDIIRPSEESIVAAIKRLSASYSMLDKSKLLSDVSEKVTQHIVFGREASEVIDELEVFFQQNYRQYVTEKEALAENKEALTVNSAEKSINNSAVAVPVKTVSSKKMETDQDNEFANLPENKGT